MLQRIITLILVCGCQLLTAQVEKLMQDPDVVWMAQCQVTYSLYPPQSQDTILPNKIAIWKSYDPETRHFYLPQELLIEKLLGAVESGRWPAWAITPQIRQLSPAEVSQALYAQDTFTVNDVVTGMPQQKVVRNEPDVSTFQAIAAKHILYYRKKSATFGLITTWIAPVRRVTELRKDDFGDLNESYLYDEIPFWLKLDRSPAKSPAIESKNIIWAAEMSTESNSLRIDSMVVMKDYQLPVMHHLLERFRLDPDYACEDWSGKPIPFSAREAMIVRSDTVVTFDPETYEEKVTIVNNQIFDEYLTKLRLVERWYWDDKRSRLLIYPDRFAPLTENHDSEGNFRFWFPLFFHRFP